MGGGWFSFFDVPGCFRPHLSRSRSHQPIMPSSSEFYSPRIAEMMEKLKSNPGMDKGEFEVESSKVTWSELSTSSVLVGDALAAENKRVFESLQEQWPPSDESRFWGFFEGWEEGEWEVGEKIAEGAQAELFELWRITPEGKGYERPVVIKMFKEGLSLQDLQRLLPHGMLADERIRTRGIFYGGFNCNTIYGAMLFNGRFALWMGKRWGDLRKLIDGRMIHNRMDGPPFAAEETAQCMLEIAMGMIHLHERNIIHRDSKAANVLVEGLDPKFDPMKDDVYCFVADYEYSVG